MGCIEIETSDSLIIPSSQSKFDAPSGAHARASISSSTNGPASRLHASNCLSALISSGLPTRGTSITQFGFCQPSTAGHSIQQDVIPPRSWTCPADPETSQALSDAVPPPFPVPKTTPRPKQRRIVSAAKIAPSYVLMGATLHNGHAQSYASSLT